MPEREEGESFIAKPCFHPSVRRIHADAGCVVACCPSVYERERERVHHHYRHDGPTTVHHNWQGTLSKNFLQDHILSFSEKLSSLYLFYTGWLVSMHLLILDFVVDEEEEDSNLV